MAAGRNNRAGQRQQNGGDRRRRHPLRAGQLLPRAVPAAWRRFGFAEASLVAEWAAVAGERVAAICQPERLSRDGVLSLRVAPAFALELQHLEPQLLERIATFFGHRAVRRLKLRQGDIRRRRAPPTVRLRPLAAAEARWLEDRIAAIDRDDLRQALRRLGRAVLGAAPQPRDSSTEGAPAEAGERP